jgi:hypothetical protein
MVYLHCSKASGIFEHSKCCPCLIVLPADAQQLDFAEKATPTSIHVNDILYEWKAAGASMTYISPKASRKNLRSVIFGNAKPLFP